MKNVYIIQWRFKEGKKWVSDDRYFTNKEDAEYNMKKHNYYYADDEYRILKFVLKK